MGFAILSISLAIGVFVSIGICSGKTYECDESECYFRIKPMETNEDVHSMKFLLTYEAGLVAVDLSDSAMPAMPKSLFVDNGNKIEKLDVSASRLLAIQPDTFAQAHVLSGLYMQRNFISELHNYMFANATNLTTIKFALNKVKDIGEFTFQGLTVLEDLELSHNKIRNLPRTLFAGLRRLSLLQLQHNRIVELEETLFEDLAELNELDLSSNRIEKLSNGAFVGMPQLKKLELQNNHISTIEPNTFASLRSLETLDLSQNLLKDLPSELFHNTTSLVELRMDHNSFVHLNQGLFSNICTLETLELDNNNLRWLDGALLKSLRKLKTLSLESNHLSPFAPGTFDHLESLEVLILSNNGITSIDTGLFRRLRFVETLFLTNNRIGSLNNGTFQGLVRMEQLYLDNNEITQIDGEAGDVFCSHPLLRVISLKGNRLSRFRPETFECLQTLNELDLSDNRLQNFSVALENLHELDLSNNRFSILPDDAFAKLKNLNMLNMDNNYLEVIPKTVAKLPNLATLSLKNNKIKSTAAANALQTLQRLYLSNNEITHVQLDQYEDLRHLYLDRNRIVAIPETAFAKNRELRKLDLSENRLTGPLENRFKYNNNMNDLRLDGNPLGCITSATFNGLGGGINILSLQNTSLTELSNNTFQTFSYIARLDLSQNNFSNLGENGLRGGEWGFFDLFVNENGANFEDLRGLTRMLGEKLTTISVAANSWKIPDDLLENKVSLVVLYIKGARFSNLPSEFFRKTKGSLEVLTISNNQELSILTTHFFKNVPLLKRLTLSNNSLSVLEPGVFDPLVLLEMLDISDNPLVTLDKELFAKTYSLNNLILRNTNLTDLPLGIFDSLDDLTTLDLSQNHLSSIPTGIFSKLYSLKTLSLEKNGIVQLVPGVFDGVSGLKNIFLGHNEMSSLHPELFSNLRRIYALDLSHNNFVSLDLTSFQNTIFFLRLDSNALASLKIHQIERLSLDDNKLSSIEVDQSEDSFSILTHLSAERNQFTSFESFVKFRALNILHASFNDFAELDAGKISTQLPALRELNVSDCNVRLIKTDGIHQQTTLAHLDISNNNLTSLEIGALSTLPSLQSFVFGGNTFDSFAFSDLLVTLPELRYIGLEGTQWKCEFLRSLETPMRDSLVGFWFKPQEEGHQKTCAKDVNGVCCI